MTLVERVCYQCGDFPCHCARVRYPRFERCVCGGTIVADRPEDIFVAVRAHNASSGHNVWRAGRR